MTIRPFSARPVVCTNPRRLPQLTSGASNALVLILLAVGEEEDLAAVAAVAVPAVAMVATAIAMVVIAIPDSQPPIKARPAETADAGFVTTSAIGRRNADSRRRKTRKETSPVPRPTVTFHQIQSRTPLPSSRTDSIMFIRPPTSIWTRGRHNI